MAERRMFHTAVVESDAFLDLPAGAQALYFHLGMQADDDGFLNGPRQIARKLRRPAKELQLLVENGFLLDFDGIMVIRHWRVANNWQSDRLQLPRHPEIAEKIFIRPDRMYELTKSRGSKNLLREKTKLMRQHGIQMDSQKRREKKKTEKKNIEKISIEQKKEEKDPPCGAEDPEPPGNAGGPCGGTDGPPTYDDIDSKNKRSVIKMTAKQVNDLIELMGLEDYTRYVLKLASFIRRKDADVKDHYATMRKWWEEDRRV